MKTNYKVIIVVALLLLIGISIYAIKYFANSPHSSENFNAPVSTAETKPDLTARNAPSMVSDKPSTGPVSVIELIPTFVKTRPDARRRAMLASGRVITLAPGNTLTLQCDEDFSVLKIEPDQTGTRFLVDHGSKGFSIYNSDGELTKTLPEVSQLLPELADPARFQWTWANGEKLVAILEVYDKQEPNQYPETDQNPKDVRYFLYSTDTGVAHELQIPSRTKGLLLRMDGVSIDGLLLFGEVKPNLYFDKGQGKFMDAYKIPE